MNTSDLVVLLSSVTAIIAVVAPVVSTLVTVKSNERIARLKLRIPQNYEAINRMVSAYSKLQDNNKCDYLADADDFQTRHRMLTEYHEFMAAAYSLMTLVTNESIHQQIIELVASIKQNHYTVYVEDNEMFNKLICDITVELALVNKHVCHIKAKHKKRKHN